MLRNGDFSACIFVDGKEVEYFEVRTKLDDSEEGREVVHAYIIGEPGKNFTVSWKDHRGIHASSGHIFVDGKDVASAIMRAGRGKPVSRSGAKISANKLRPFKFGHLNVTSDDKLADKKRDKERLREMSTIRLAITYVQLGSVVPFKAGEVTEWGHVHEEAKALGLMTEYDAKIDIPASRAVASRPLNPDQGGPDAQFVFTYATKDHLMAADIIPNPKVPRFPKVANPKDTIVIDAGEDDSQGRVSPPQSPSKRPRNNKRASSDAADDDDGPELQKRAKLNASTRRSPPSNGHSSPAALNEDDDDDIAELQRHINEYNLRNSQNEEEETGPEDESSVSRTMRVNDEESQDL